MLRPATEVSVSTIQRTVDPAADGEVREMFRPSGCVLAAQMALAKVIETYAVAPTPYSATVMDLLVRLRLAPNQRLRGVDICRQVLKSPGYVSRVIDQAESAGLVERTPDPHDRRAQQIVLSPDGEAALELFVPRAIELLDTVLFGVLDEDEVSQLIDMLDRVTDAAHAMLERHQVAPHR